MLDCLWNAKSIGINTHRHPQICMHEACKHTVNMYTCITVRMYVPYIPGDHMYYKELKKKMRAHNVVFSQWQATHIYIIYIDIQP